MIETCSAVLFSSMNMPGRGIFMVRIPRRSFSSCGKLPDLLCRVSTASPLVKLGQRERKQQIQPEPLSSHAFHSGGRNRWVHLPRARGSQIGEGFLVKLPCRAITAPLAGLGSRVSYRDSVSCLVIISLPSGSPVHACIWNHTSYGYAVTSLISPAGAAVPDPELVFPRFWSPSAGDIRLVTA